MLGDITRHELLCVSAQPSTRSSMRVKRWAKPFDVPPLKPGSRGDPTGPTGDVSRGDRLAGYAFSSAPSGTSPVSLYRHSAMITRRAKATMPMRRVTAPPPPTRR